MVAPSQQFEPVGDGVLEPIEIDVPPGDGDPVAGRLTHQDRGGIAWPSAGLERRAQSRDVHLQRRLRLVGRLAPQQLDQTVDRHDAIAFEQQHREHRTLLGRPQVDGAFAGDDAQSAQDLEAHRTGFGTGRVDLGHGPPRLARGGQ